MRTARFRMPFAAAPAAIAAVIVVQALAPTAAIAAVSVVQGQPLVHSAQQNADRRSETALAPTAARPTR